MRVTYFTPSYPRVQNLFQALQKLLNVHILKSKRAKLLEVSFI